MTNIRTEGFFPEVVELAEHHRHPSHPGLMELFEMRRKTYKGFAEIECDKGLLHPEMSLSTTEGQEAIRILVQRGLEEMVEAFDSRDRDHYLEELVDAINYFWVMVIIDPEAPLWDIGLHMTTSLMNHVHCPNTGRFGILHLGQLLTWLGPVFEKLRHRAWMHHAQSQYFDGWPEIMTFLSDHLCLVWDQFDSWTEFVQFFIAKDRVLQFRIRTRY